MNGISKEPLLSICIPTFNRDYALKLCLERLCPLIYQKNVSICISDNCSTDNTEYVVREFMQKYSNIVYVRQAKNIGPDYNFEYVLKMSTAKYSWLLGDSCYVEGLELLLDNLQQNDWDVCVVGDVNRLRMKEGIINIYSDSRLLLREWGWHMTWISCLIYSKRLIEQANYARYYNSRFLQTGIVFEYFCTHLCKVVVNSAITVGSFNIPKIGHWRNIIFEVFCRDWYLFVMSLPVYYSYEDKLYCIKSHGIKSGLFTYRSVCALRYEKILNMSMCCKYRFFIKQTIALNFLYLCFVSIIPVIILDICKFIKQKLI